ncbi:MAG: MFS transporter [Flavobacteriia bacterium]|nr:MFS transporter [Flavobacteriia bacterium]
MQKSNVFNDTNNQLLSKVSWRILPLLFCSYICAYLDRINIGFASKNLKEDLNFSDSVYGLGAGIFFLGYALFEIPSNVIMEKVGARRWIARIMITWGIISGAMAFVNSPFTFYILRFFLGVAEAGFFPGIILYLTYWFPGSRRAKMVALFMTAIAVSNLVGSPLSGAIMQYMDGAAGVSGWKWLFLLEGVPSIVVGFMVFYFLPNGPRDAKWLTTEEQDYVIAQVEADEKLKTTDDSSHHWMDAFRDIRVWALAFVYFSGVVCFYAINFWMPTIIQELGVDKKDFFKVGLISIIPWGIAAVFMVVWGDHSDKTGERRYHVAGSLLLCILGLIGLAFVGKAPIPSIIALTVVASGVLAFVAIFWSLPTAFLTGTAAAAGIAFINSVGNLGGHFGPDLIGRVRNLSGGATEAAFWALAAIAAVGVIITLMISREQATDQPA